MRTGLASIVTVILILALIGIVWWGLAFFRQQPYSQELPKTLQQPTIKPQPTIKQTGTYTNDKFKFTFEAPSSWTVGEISAKNEKILHSILQLTPPDFKGNIPPIKLLYADNPNKLSLQELEKKINSDLVTPILYSDDDVYMLSGKGIAVNFREKGNCVTTKCQIYTFSFGDKVYQLVNFPEANISNQDAALTLVMSSFKFLDSPTQSTLGTSNSASPK